MDWNVLAVRRLIDFDVSVCHHANRACVVPAIRRFFSLISWLGNGKLWYLLMIVLPVFGGPKGLYVSLQMAAAGLAGLALYKGIKHLTHRPRPYMTHASIVLGAAPLDQFSFPSGHTLHAVCFSIIIGSAFPALIWVLLPLTLLTAASRVVLGLHYPTDVLLGACIGGILAVVVLLVLPLASVITL